MPRAARWRLARSGIGAVPAATTRCGDCANSHPSLELRTLDLAARRGCVRRSRATVACRHRCFTRGGQHVAAAFDAPCGARCERHHVREPARCDMARHAPGARGSCMRRRRAVRCAHVDVPRRRAHGIRTRSLLAGHGGAGVSRELRRTRAPRSQFNHDRAVGAAFAMRKIAPRRACRARCRRRAGARQSRRDFGYAPRWPRATRLDYVLATGVDTGIREFADAGGRRGWPGRAGGEGAGATAHDGKRRIARACPRCAGHRRVAQRGDAAKARRADRACTAGHCRPLPGQCSMPSCAVCRAGRNPLFVRTDLLILNVDAISAPLTGIGMTTRLARGLRGARDLHGDPARRIVSCSRRTRWVTLATPSRRSRSIARSSRCVIAAVSPVRAGRRVLKLRAELFRANARRLRDHVLHAPNFVLMPFEGPTVATVHDICICAIRSFIRANACGFSNGICRRRLHAPTR